MRRFNAVWAKTLAAANTVWPQAAPPPRAAKTAPSDVAPVVEGPDPAVAAATVARRRSHFDSLYAASPDPWSYATSVYEQDKYAATLDALLKERYPRALEVGCSIGVLTRLLATHCDRLLATDISPLALEHARTRCADLPHVEFACMAFPQDCPAERFDLVVLSEILYYLDPIEIAAAARTLADLVERGGDVHMVHWTAHSRKPVKADLAIDALVSETSTAFDLIVAHRATDYRLDILRRSA
jgi:SAM-dependent methyltransferase